jgi:hypothetical protein
MKYSEIKRVTQDAGYCVDVGWTYLESHLDSWQSRDYCPVEFEPDFQRGHVWTREQQIAYVENKLRGAVPHDVIRWNCKGWGGNYDGPMQIVDGLQRLTSARMFLRDELPAFGCVRSAFEDRIPSHVSFKFAVNTLRTRKEVLRWYLELNTGGTPHAQAEIARVSALLDAEP